MNLHTVGFHHNPGDFRTALDLLSGGQAQVTSPKSHRLPLDEIVGRRDRGQPSREEDADPLRQRGI